MLQGKVRVRSASERHCGLKVFFGHHVETQGRVGLLPEGSIWSFALLEHHLLQV